MIAEAIIHEKGGTVIEGPYITASGVVRARVRCAAGHEWTPLRSNIANSGSWCPDCYGNSLGEIEDLHAWAKKMGGRCLSEVYVNRRSAYEWECGRGGHLWSATWGSVKSAHSWCPECQASFREQTVRAAFQEVFPGESFAKNLTAVGMELDGYSEKLRLAFEHDGLQHRVRVLHFQPNEGDFEAQQERDARKTELCIAAGITLVRVPDREIVKHLEIRARVHNTLAALGYELPGDFVGDAEFFEAVGAARGVSPYLDRVTALVEDRGGVTMSGACSTRTSPIEVTCDVGHAFKTNFDNLDRGRWCPLCAHTAPKQDDELLAVAEARGYAFIGTETRASGGRSRRYISLQCPNSDHPSIEVLWDNFKKGRGCQPCGRARAGATRRASGVPRAARAPETVRRMPAVDAERRLAAVGVTIEGEYRSLVAEAVFRCVKEPTHRFTSSVKKVEQAAANSCPVCSAGSFPDVQLADPYTLDVDPVRTQLRWSCRGCDHITVSTLRGMRSRKHRCVNGKCPLRAD